MCVVSAITVGIAGGSGSGKSTLAARIAACFPAVAILREDDYYLPQDHLSETARTRVNYDAPDAIDRVLFLQHLCDLQAGKRVLCPVYDYARHTRADTSRAIESAPIVIVEGLFVLYDMRIRARCDLRIFVDVPEHERLLRRLARDVHERGRRESDVRAQFARTVAPMHDRYIAPSSVFADLTVTGGGQNPAAIGAAVKKIKELQKIQESELCRSK